MRRLILSLICSSSKAANLPEAHQCRHNFLPNYDRLWPVAWATNCASSVVAKVLPFSSGKSTPGRSTRGHVGIAQDVGLTLQILQTVLDYITDADDTGELAVAQHRHVAHAMARHQL